MFEMTTCHFNYFRLWHSGTFFCHILWVKNGSGEKREMGGYRVNNEEKKVINFIFVYCIKCLLGWGVRCLFVCENQRLIIILFMAKNHLEQVEQSYVLRARMIAMCTFLFCTM